MVIEGAAFMSCSNLAFVSVPNSVTFIGSKAFDGCKCIVICSGETPPHARETSFSSLMTAIVPLGTTEAYQDATGWKNMRIKNLAMI